MEDYCSSKTFSAKEPSRGGGPNRFSIDEIDSIFSDRFVRESFMETVYQGTLDILPKALFVVLRKKKTLGEGESL
jgi:hypothetical protein